MTHILFLTVKEPYYSEIESGKKGKEYREYKEYWISRIVKNEKNLRGIEIRLGPNRKKGDPRNLVFLWSGYTIETIIHPNFGNVPTKVFVIPLVK
jgi:hypothetical protein